MKLKFAGAFPFSSGCALTEEDRERLIREQLPRSFTERTNNMIDSGIVVIMKGPKTLPPFWEWLSGLLYRRRLPPYAIIMRRRLSGYEWRLYLIDDPEILFYEMTANEYKDLKVEGYEVSVVAMATKLFGGNTLSRPVMHSYEEYMKHHPMGKSAFKQWLNSQADRASVY